jgi:tRNA dimethylallyltransferase
MTTTAYTHFAKALDQGIQTCMIFGPTAIGKSSLALDLAEKIGAEIISADAFQVYKSFDIGTAKIPLQERRGIQHHLIDICEPDIQYTVKAFSDAAKKLISKPHKPMIICGGTGLYCHALLYDFRFLEEDGDQTIRDHLQQRLAAEGKDALYAELHAKDPDYASRIDSQNPARILRGLAILESGALPSVARPLTTDMRNDICCIGLSENWQKLTHRIHSRTIDMIQNGWIDEVKNLLDSGVSRHAPAFKALGYREIADYLADQISYETCLETIQIRTRQFAKRQLTWFKRYHHAQWIQLDQTHFV